MDVKESFQTEDISKTDFFDFVTAPDMNIQRGDNKFYHEESNDAARNLQPLQGFDQVRNFKFKSLLQLKY